MAKVLVVDDQRDVREAIVAVVDFEGHEVVEAEDGEEAIARALETRPDLILMDGNMPGMDGFEAVSRLKASGETAGIPVVMVTVLNGSEARERAAALGVDAYVTKPWGDGELGWVISRALAASAAAGNRLYTAAPLP